MPATLGRAAAIAYRAKRLCVSAGKRPLGLWKRGDEGLVAASSGLILVSSGSAEPASVP
jgi:hypothetical protein